MQDSYKRKRIIERRFSSSTRWRWWATCLDYWRQCWQRKKSPKHHWKSHLSWW